MMAIKSSFKNMVLSLGLITLVCGALLSVVYTLTAEPIALAVEKKTREAISAVLPDVSSIENRTSADGIEYYEGIGKDGATAGYVLNVSSTGFGGPIRLMVGFRPDGTIYGVSVLEHSETPGLGAKCTDDPFLGQFREFNPSVSKLSVRKEGGDVDAITASTITSKGFCSALRKAVETFSSIVPQASAEDIVENTEGRQTQIMEDRIDE